MKVLKRITALALSLIMAGTAAVPVYADWETKDGKTYYQNESGDYVTGWQKIDNSKYYFNKKGEMVTKNTVIDGICYKFGKDGVCKGKYTGWTKSSKGRRYWKNGELVKNEWINSKDGTRYYAGKDGYITKTENENKEENTSAMCSAFVNSYKSTFDGLIPVVFPNEQGDFIDSEGMPCVSQVFYGSENDAIPLAFAYVRDTDKNTLKRVYDPSIQYTAPQSIGDYRVKSASMLVHLSDGLYYSNGLYMNCVTLAGDIKIKGTLSVEEDSIIFTATETNGLPSLNPSSDFGFKACFTANDECYDALRKAFDNGDNQVTLSSNEVKIAFKPGFSTYYDWLSFDEVKIEI